VLNKRDLIDRATLEAILRELSLESGIDALAISAQRRDSLTPLLERIEQELGIQTAFQIQHEQHSVTTTPNRPTSSSSLISATSSGR